MNIINSSLFLYPNNILFYSIPKLMSTQNHKITTFKKKSPPLTQNSHIASKLLKLHSRIHKIIDEQFAQMSQKLSSQEAIQKLLKKNVFQKDVLINQSMLEDWVEMFRHEVLVIKDDSKEEDYDKEDNCRQECQLKKLQFQRPLRTCYDSQKSILWTVEASKLNVFEFNAHNDRKPLNQPWKQTTYKLPENTIKPFCSITHCPQSHQLIIIGGSKATNPNIKSSKIYQLNLQTSQLSRIASLPYGLSSHTAVYNELSHQIYIIGGNKNHSIITRGCFKLKLRQKIVEEISCLNYPAANVNCVMWKGRWVYKFGGIGEAFGGWDVSPYIERQLLCQICRYDTLTKEWQVINPIVSYKENSAQSFSNLMHTNSSSYLCQENNKILVFGGYSIGGKFQDKAFVLQVNGDQQQSDVNGEGDVQHVIRGNSLFYLEYGFIDCGEIVSNSFAFCSNQDGQILMYGLRNSFQNNGQFTQPSLIHLFPYNCLKQ